MAGTSSESGRSSFGRSDKVSSGGARTIAPAPLANSPGCPELSGRHETAAQPFACEAATRAAPAVRPPRT
jgi:hypothetical protein